MRTITLFSVLVVLLSVLSFGCQSQDNVTEERVAERQREEAVQETKEARQEVGEAITETKIEFKQGVETTLNALERDIDQLEAKAADVAEASRDEFNNMINELNEKKAEANAKLKQLESAGADAWEQAKSGITAAINDLQNTYNRVASRFE